MLKKSKVVMLPVKEAGIVCLYNNKLSSRLTPEYFENDDSRYVEQHLYVLSDNEIKEGDWYYEEEYDRILQCKSETQGGIVSNWQDCFKVIASTDELIISHNINDPDRIEDIEIYVPQIPTSFIKYFIAEYNKGNTVSEVQIEYKYGDEVCRCGIKREDHFSEKGGKIYSTYRHVYVNGGELKPKVCKDNIIFIKPIKDSWSREEVEYLILTAYDEVCGRAGYWEQMNEWIKENL